MADNYIERQYEQYEARKAAWEKKRKQGKKKTISVKLQPKDLTDNTIKLPRKSQSEQNHRNSLITDFEYLQSDSL
jgi:hypothetical protein